MTVVVNAYCTHRSPPPIEFPTIHLQLRDRSDRELGEHIDGFIGYIMQNGQREMTKSLYAVYRHLQRVQNHFSFEIEAENIEAIVSWAVASNAILFFPDGSVRDPFGAVLVDPDTGEADTGAKVPYPKLAWDRRQRTITELEQRSLSVPKTLPPVVSEDEVKLQSADDVAWRAIALFGVAVRAESLGSNEPIPIEELKKRLPLAFRAFTPSETDFIESADPEPQAIINFAWRYEALLVLQWALGLHELVPFPEAICDVPLVARKVLDPKPGQLLRSATLRDTGEILDALDLNYCLMWSARDAAIQKQQPPAGLDPGVIEQRQHALNWLVRFEDADWDQVEIPS